jgi:Fic family protein
MFERLNIRLKFSSDEMEQIYALIAEIDSVKKSWFLTGRILPQALERLTQSVIVTSTGSSNRIEGNLLSDEQVEELYNNLHIKKFRNRDEQEVGGYLEAMKLIFSEYDSIAITENHILQIHKMALEYSNKDQRHKGAYKIGPNRVEAKNPDGKVVGIIFDPTPPHLVKKEMLELTDWFGREINGKRHPLITIANFIFEFLAIHPFQDGNGRTSRLLTNLVLLRSGYHFSSIVSHEKVIEERKADYYLSLNKTQKTWKSGHENIYPWLSFFLGVVNEQAQRAIKILQEDNTSHLLSAKQVQILEWFTSQKQIQEFSRRDIVAALKISPRTVEESIKKLTQYGYLNKIGQGPATRYRLK